MLNHFVPVFFCSTVCMRERWRWDEEFPEGLRAFHNVKGVGFQLLCVFACSMTDWATPTSQPLADTYSNTDRIIHCTVCFLLSTTWDVRRLRHQRVYSKYWRSQWGCRLHSVFTWDTWDQLFHLTDSSLWHLCILRFSFIVTSVQQLEFDATFVEFGYLVNI